LIPITICLPAEDFTLIRKMRWTKGESAMTRAGRRDHVSPSFDRFAYARNQTRREFPPMRRGKSIRHLEFAERRIQPSGADARSKLTWLLRNHIHLFLTLRPAEVFTPSCRVGLLNFSHNYIGVYIISIKYFTRDVFWRLETLGKTIESHHTISFLCFLIQEWNFWYQWYNSAKYLLW